ncbi:MAG TPA: hypothetical protein D7I06_08445 [Candidatus Poseidoniales archaeon]|nr:MAG TPA: hypothetical protein D7I06_08445 [Candidatus Poseidoniales archaeon]HII63619.1 hypothetical protein [Candidatus Poseidoniaceae archaeon]|tara:strand:- start:336 stop:992 length:657 start_codon:yes stop_codon:yes gene_type:complete
MPCNRGYITNWNWTEAQRPITDLRTIFLSLKQLGIQWLNAPQLIVDWHNLRNSISSNQSSADRIIALTKLENLVKEIQKLDNSDVNLSNGIQMSWRNGSFSIGKQETVRRGEQSQTREIVSNFVSEFDSAYASVEGEMRNELENIIADIESGKSQLAAEEIEVQRARIQTEREALSKSRQQLREQRMKHVESVGEELGYAVRKQRIGKKIKYVLVRNP